MAVNISFCIYGISSVYYMVKCKWNWENCAVVCDFLMHFVMGLAIHVKHLTHLCLVDFCLNSLDWSISSRRGLWFLLIPCFKEIPVFNANSVDPNQMPHSAESDRVCTVSVPFFGTLGINGLMMVSCFIYPFQHYLSRMHKWVKDRF